MAAAVPMASQPIEPSSNTPKTANTQHQRRPLPLSSNQEQQVRDLYYKNVRAMCADEIKAFAECAQSRTITATFLCRTPRLAMNTCMLQHATQENMDAARTQWFAAWRERKAAREMTEKRVEEAKKFHKEWWGLDDEGKRKVEFFDPEDREHAEMLRRREKELAEMGVTLEKGREGKKRG